MPIGVPPRKLDWKGVWTQERSGSFRGSARQKRPPSPTGKNAPTPKRSVQQAQNQRPLVPTDRKLARAAEREQRLDAQNRMRLANETGDERFMLPATRDRRSALPATTWTRRFMVGEYLMFAVFAFLIVSLSLSKFPQVTVYITFALWVLVALVAIDAFIMSRGLKKAPGRASARPTAAYSGTASCAACSSASSACPSRRCAAARTRAKARTSVQQSTPRRVAPGRT